MGCLLVNYWLCVTNEENWEIIKEKRVWGVPKRSRGFIEKVNVGDLLVFYVSPKKITGIFRAISESFYDEDRIFSFAGFKREEIFPYRVKLEPVVIAEEPVQFDELISKLKFIVNKKRWTGYLRRAMVSIPKEDYDLIFRAISH